MITEGARDSGADTALAALSSEVCDAARRVGEYLTLAIDGMGAKADDYAQMSDVREQARSVASVAGDVHLKEAAEAAGLVKDYTEYYPLLSKAAHSTPTGLAYKTEPLFVAAGVLRLLHDALETAGSLVFWRGPGDSAPVPVTAAWEEVYAGLRSLQLEYFGLRSRFDELLTMITSVTP